MRGGAISRTASSIIAAADPELKLCAYDTRASGNPEPRLVLPSLDARFRGHDRKSRNGSSKRLQLGNAGATFDEGFWAIARRVLEQRGCRVFFALPERQFA